MNNKNPKYDNEFVTLGYLKKTFQNSGESTTDLTKYISKNYTSPPAPPYYVGTVLYYNHKTYRCKKDKIQGVFDIGDWEVVATDDNGLTKFVSNTYNVDKSNILKQLDNKIETYYQSTDPSTTWTADLEKVKHIGDLWYNTNNDTQWRYCQYDTNPITYGWSPVDVPESVYDSINSKKSIYTVKPTSYKQNDMWIIEQNLDENDLPEDETNPIAVGDWVFATQDSNSYDKTHWKKMDNYSIDINRVSKKAESDNRVTNLKFNDYVTKSTFLITETRIHTIEEGTYKKWEVNEKLTDGSVTKVNTQSCTLDINGMTYERPGEPTKSTINNVGITTRKKDNDDIILFAGYVDENNTQYSDYKGQTIVATDNIINKNHFVMTEAHSRMEKYEGGGGMFNV